MWSWGTKPCADDRKTRFRPAESAASGHLILPRALTYAKRLLLRVKRSESRARPPQRVLDLFFFLSRKGPFRKRCVPEGRELWREESRQVRTLTLSQLLVFGT